MGFQRWVKRVTAMSAAVAFLTANSTKKGAEQNEVVLWSHIAICLLNIHAVTNRNKSNS